MSTTSLYILLVVVAMSISTAQVLMKYAALAFGGSGWLAPSFIVPLGVSFTISIVAQLVWLWALQFVPLGQGYMALALTFVFVPLLSKQFFQEPVSPVFAGGVVLIVTGVLLTVRG